MHSNWIETQRLRASKCAVSGGSYWMPGSRDRPRSSRIRCSMSDIITWYGPRDGKKWHLMQPDVMKQNGRRRSVRRHGTHRWYLQCTYAARQLSSLPLSRSVVLEVGLRLPPRTRVREVPLALPNLPGNRGAWAAASNVRYCMSGARDVGRSLVIYVP